MTDQSPLGRATTHLPGGAGAEDPVLVLDYAARLVRRRRLETESGRPVLVDLPSTTSLADGDALGLEGGGQVAIRARPEPLLSISGPDLPRLAWHLGNRHTPCQISASALLIREDPVLENLVRHLGAEVARVEAPFSPEGGAYGHGRTLGHSHHDHEH
ncbi:MAG: urease accessory protein UreE [Pseudomonadota bacterium]